MLEELINFGEILSSREIKIMVALGHHYSCQITNVKTSDQLLFSILKFFERKIENLQQNSDKLNLDINVVVEEFETSKHSTKLRFVEKYPDGASYFGELDHQRRRSGLGRYNYTSGAIYVGEWKGGLRKGIIFFFHEILILKGKGR